MLMYFGLTIARTELKEQVSDTCMGNIDKTLFYVILKSLQNATHSG